MSGDPFGDDLEPCGAATMRALQERFDRGLEGLPNDLTLVGNGYGIVISLDALTVWRHGAPLRAMLVDDRVSALAAELVACGMAAPDAGATRGVFLAAVRGYSEQLLQNQGAA